MSRADELFARLRAAGESEIDLLISDFQSENLWVDFKRSADAASGSKLHQNDRENFAKALSGFGNSDGGVIIWGIDCRRDPTTGADLPSGKFPLTNPAAFVSWLENTLSSCVTPPVPGVESIVLPSNGSSGGFVASLIPNSHLAPHQALQPPGKLQYYMRAGSNFVAVPHAILAGMFGRRPQPRIFHFFEGRPSYFAEGGVLDLDVAILVMNEGAAPASDPYLSFKILVPRPNSRVGFQPREADNWCPNQRYGVFFNLTSKPDFRLAPHTPVNPVRFKIQLAPPFEGRYQFQLYYGCTGSPSGHVNIELASEELARLHEKYSKLLQTAEWTDALDEVFTTFFGGKGGAG
jgi:hypothetical protein